MFAVKKDDAMRLVVQMCCGKKAVIWNDFQCKVRDLIQLLPHAE